MVKIEAIGCNPETSLALKSVDINAIKLDLITLENLSDIGSDNIIVAGTISLPLFPNQIVPCNCRIAHKTGMRCFPLVHCRILDTS